MNDDELVFSKIVDGDLNFDNFIWTYRKDMSNWQKLTEKYRKILKRKMGHRER